MRAERYDYEGKAIYSLKFDGATIVGDLTGEKSIITPSWILVHPDLSPLAKVLFGYMKAILMGEVFVADTSHGSFANLLKVDARTIRRKIKELNDVGAIIVKNTFKDNKQQTNIYYLWPYNPDLGWTNLSGGTELSGGVDTDVQGNINNNIYNNIISPQGEGRKTRKAKVYTPEFEALWLLYPRKENKSGAFEAYNGRIRDDKIPYKTLMQAVKNYAIKRKNENPLYTLHPKTFFGPGRRYEDYLGESDDVFPLTPEQLVIAEIYEDWDKLKTWINPVDGEVILDNPVKMNYSRPTNEIGQPIDIDGRPYKLDNQGRRHSLEFTTY